MDTALETTYKLLFTFHAMGLHVNQYMIYHLSQAQHLTEFQQNLILYI